MNLNVDLHSPRGKIGEVHVVEGEERVRAPRAVFHPPGVAWREVVVELWMGVEIEGLRLQTDIGLEVTEVKLRDVQTDTVLVEGKRRGLCRSEGAVLSPLEIIRQVEVGQ